MRGDLGECKVRVSTQEKMLAQKELQLLDGEEQRGALQAERDGLKGALKHLETQHCNASREAHQQAQTMVSVFFLSQQAMVSSTNISSFVETGCSTEKGKERNGSGS